MKIDTYVSSLYGKSSCMWISFANKENISGNHKYDDSLRTASGVTIPYIDVPVMFTGMITDSCQYIDKSIEVGDNIIIIGTFNHRKAGDYDSLTDFYSAVEYGSIDADLVYKK